MNIVTDADRVLRNIDHVLANKPIDLDDLLCHPGQLHVAVVKLTTYRKWLDGDVGDDELQAAVDSFLNDVVSDHSETVRTECWLCGHLYPGDDETCAGCRKKWAEIVAAPGRVVHDDECREEDWQQLMKQLAPEVDGIQHRCADHHKHMASLR